jgi:hypothetical protein
LKNILGQIRDIASSEQGKELEYFCAELRKALGDQKYLLVALFMGWIMAHIYGGKLILWATKILISSRGVD